MRLIGLTGAARSGKDTLAYHLRMRHNFESMAFADPIKRGVCSTFGLTPDKPDEDKEAIIPWLGKSRRELYQKFGTEFGRDNVSDDVWIKVAQNNLDKKIKSEATNPAITVDCGGIVFTDVRFDNEAQFIIDNGGYVIEVDRPEELRVKVRNHKSENGLSDGLIDVTIKNDGSITDLYEDMDKILEALKCKTKLAV